MPGQDRTGPQGKGSRTGRGLGPCGSNTESEAQDNKLEEQNIPRGRVRRGDGRGLGQSSGRGQGRGRGRNQ